MNKQQLIQNIKARKSFLCVGLDTDTKKIPAHLLNEEDPIFAFNKAIIDATADYCVAYKPNLAFYECDGLKGYEAYEKTIAYLKANYPDHFIIADAKRGDIGETQKYYAQAYFERMQVDAVTLNGLLSPIERAEAIERVANGAATLLYIAPEQLRSKTVEKLLVSRNVVRFVIDEAHCFSAWGHDFRVDYLYIGDFIRELQRQKMMKHPIPVSCFTATAKQNDCKHGNADHKAGKTCNDANLDTL